MTSQVLVAGSLGSVWVQPDGNTPPVETLHIHDAESSGQRITGDVRLFDAAGVSVKPKSPRLGFHGKRGTATMSIVCDDDVSDATMQRLVAAGYLRVIRRA
jgi:hypothetical protein